VLGPSHYATLHNSCGLSRFLEFETPFGALKGCVDMAERLSGEAGGSFKYLSADDDEQEHSIEMQLPLLRYYFPRKDLAVLPIMVGHFTDSIQRGKAAAALAATLRSARDFVMVISSDFCHYGPRFGYTPDFDGHVSSSAIKRMDLEAFECIASSDSAVEKFNAHLQATHNTICGREAILLGLDVLERLNIHGNWQLLEYSQSNEVRAKIDSSVSYLSAGLFVQKEASLGDG
jgi:AmmeMemoRadiSam system protein B